MRKFLIIVLILIPALACAQFTQKFDTSRGETAIDSTALSAAKSIKPTEPEILNFTLYSDAYDQYVRRELFKQRNKLKIRSALTITQTMFDNWAKGGNNSFAGRAYAFVEHSYRKNAFEVKSTFEGAYTITATQDYLRKSEDFLNITSTPSWNLSKRWMLSGSAILKSQFANSFAAPGDTTLVSSFFAPATLNLSAGVSYRQPNSKLEIYLAPLSGSLLMVLNKELADKGGFGMETGKQFDPQIGALLRITYGIEFAKKKISFDTKLETFWQYNRTVPTLWWENKLNFKFTNLLGANLYVLAIYNDQISTPRIAENNFWQINESLGFGLTFNFDSKPNSGPSKSDVTKVRSKKHRR